MITPLDIENKEFKKSLRGYKEEEVDEFLDQVKEDFEKLYKENIELKDKLNMMTEQVTRYKNIEETLKNTLIVAQNTAEDVNATALKKAQVIIEEAELKARKIIENANNEVIDIKKEYEEIRKEFKIFKNKFKSLLENQIKTVEETFEDIE
ncbi:cell division initiation protein [Alkalithermobacter thermoalcaliphilus JW-YL-7 = DSM 7308]|uniref:Cell division initiation protein n=1 Tax=Alkalithermobacter thermoalcaliphilus JW-YL-7 = DSM 7308 TaxID=1121328 RepID=A0A150FPN0_CLOPD|nr:DivIVA domain-containing protein [[Clostridium] paradoxum JW-YL-7 = DSM 7308]SHK97316.1 cell division initiation protein [[Clostridium] paradoxum JW-YL-7 = DSM 7308]